MIPGMIRGPAGRNKGAARIPWRGSAAVNLGHETSIGGQTATPQGVVAYAGVLATRIRAGQTLRPAEQVRGGAGHRFLETSFLRAGSSTDMRNVL